MLHKPGGEEGRGRGALIWAMPIFIKLIFVRDGFPKSLRMIFQNATAKPKQLELGQNDIKHIFSYIWLGRGLKKYVFLSTFCG